MQPIKWGKTFANHLSEKRLISKAYKELTRINSKKKKSKTQLKNKQRI